MLVRCSCVRACVRARVRSCVTLAPFSSFWPAFALTKTHYILKVYIDRTTFLVYEIEPIAIREVSPPFGEESCRALRSNKGFVYFIPQLTKNADSYGIVLCIAIDG